MDEMYFKKILLHGLNVLKKDLVTWMKCISKSSCYVNEMYFKKDIVTCMKCVLKKSCYMHEMYLKKILLHG